jgi:hypothetical protein
MPTIVAQTQKPPKVPTADGEPKPLSPEDDNAAPNANNPPASDAEKNAVRGVLAVLAMVFPELAPIFAALGINLPLGGTEVRDLPAIGKNLGAVYSAGKAADIEKLVKQLVDDTSYGNPTAAIDAYLEQLKTPVFQTGLGKTKAEELAAKLREAKQLWSRYPNAMYYLGGARTIEMVKTLHPMIASANEAEFTTYAAQAPSEVDLANWKIVLTEALLVAKSGGLKYDGAELKPVPPANQQTIEKFLKLLEATASPNDDKPKPEAEVVPA